MTRTAHAAATPAARALALLAGYTPVDAADAALLLAALHDHGNDSVLSALLAALHHLRGVIGQVPGVEPHTAQAVAGHLQAATEIICGAAADWIDRAAAALPEPEGDDEQTEGVPSWELHPAPAVDRYAASADGHTMLAVPAAAVREGDLISADGWARVTHVYVDREDGWAHLTYRHPGGRMGTRQTVAAAPVGVLRAAPQPQSAAQPSIADPAKSLRAAIARAEDLKTEATDAERAHIGAWITRAQAALDAEPRDPALIRALLKQPLIPSGGAL